MLPAWKRIGIAGALGAVYTMTHGVSSARDMQSKTHRVSQFWIYLDNLCAQKDTLQEAEIVDPAVAKSRAELLAYCSQNGNPAERVAPLFASEEEQVRLKILEALCLSVGVKFPIAEVARGAANVQTSVSEAMALHALVVTNMQGGAATTKLISELTAQICDKTGSRQWLHMTCAAMPPNAAPVVELRRRILSDLVQLPQLVAAGALQNNANLRAIRLTTAVVSSALDGADFYRLVERIAAAAPETKPSEPIIQAAEVMRRLILDGRDMKRSPEHYRRVIEAELRKNGTIAADQSLSAVQAAACKLLVEELDQCLTLALQFQANPPNRDQVQTLLLSQLRSIEHAMTLAMNLNYRLPPAGVRAVEQFLHGQPLQAAETLATLAPAVTLSPEVMRASQLVFDMLQAPDDESRERVLRTALLGIPPWTTPILFDVNVGAVALASNDLRFAGDLTVGYSAPAWGVSGHGYAREYDLNSSAAVNETSEVGGRLETWYASAATSAWRIECRFSGAASLYDTQSTQTQANALFLEETSTVMRGSLLAGLRYQKPSFASGLWLGGGAQYEWYDPLVVGATVTLNTNETLRAKGEGRFRLQWDVLPNWLTVRARIDVNAFRLTRAQTFVIVDLASGAATQGTSSNLSSQIELSSRVYLDATVIALLGFVPNINAGVDYVRLRNDATVEQKALPVVSAGIRREVF